MSRAPRIPNAQWEKHKPTIHSLYISQERKLEDVIKLMADEHGFQPTKAQYVRKLESWGFKKNSSKEKWEHAAAVVRKRKSEGKETELQMNGKVISTKKLRKEFGRYANLPSFSRAPPIEPRDDLEGVVARTPPFSLSSGFVMPNYLPWFQFQDYLASILIPRSPPVSNPGWPVFRGPPSQSRQSPTLRESSLPEQTWTGILEAKGSHSGFSELLSRHSVAMPGRPGDDTHVQLQRLSQAQPFLQEIQRVIYLAFNNLPSEEETANFLEWVTESGNNWVLKEIVNRKESTCQAFACQLLLSAIKLGNEESVSIILTRDSRPENGNAIPKDAIQIAVCSGNSRIVQLLLDHLTAVNTSDSSRQVGQYLNSVNTKTYYWSRDKFPLSSAVRHGDITMVGCLLDAGANVNNMDDDGISALHVAVEEGRLEMVEVLLQAGADVNNIDDDGISMLHVAVEEGRLEMVEILLQAGADVNNIDHHGISMLHVAVEEGRLEMVEILLQAGADVNIPLGEDYGGFYQIRSYHVPKSPLQVAAEHGMNEIVQRLLQEGADIDGTWFTSIEMFEECAEDYIDECVSPPALEQALSRGHFETAKILLNAGANIEGGCLGPTALQAACGSYSLNRLEAARLLLSRGADVNREAGVWFGRTALQAAAERGDMDLVQFLLDEGANVNAPLCDHGGITALQAAAGSGNQDLVQVLIEEGGHVNAKPAASLGVTCLQAAASSGNESIVRMLLEHGAETNAPASDRGKTALQVAAGLGNENIVRMLLEHGAETNAPASDRSETALMAAVRLGYVGVPKMLLEAGAFVNQIEGGLTPLCLAISKQSHELFELLMKYNADPNPPEVHYTPLQMAVENKDLELVSILLISGADPNRSSWTNPSRAESPLVTALRDPRGLSFSIVQALVKHGANVNNPSSQGNYPIMLALDLPNYEEAKSTMQLLLDAGADVRLSSNNRRWVDMKDSHWELMRILLDKGADIEAPISIQGTALQLAIRGGHTNIVHDLISRGADVNNPADPKRGNRTALQLAVEMGHTDIVQELILQGADINAPACSPWRRTALQLAVERDNIHIARKLISCSADVNAPPASEGGATALQFASMKGNIEMAVLLLENQADVNAARAPIQGRTALEGAAEQGRLDMVHLLLENDQDPETIEARCRDAAELAEDEDHFEIARILREWRRS